MKIKNRTLYKKINGKVSNATYYTNRRFLVRLRACLAEEMRILITYSDDEKEYRGKKPLINNSGWYEDKKELVKTAIAFLEI